MPSDTISTPHTSNICASVPSRAHFIAKLYRMLIEHEQTGLSHIMWADDGKAFTISDPQGFSRTVLPIYFKHSNFSSFTRQLNFYAFKKTVTTTGPNKTMHFYHPCFIRGQPDLLKSIQRKTYPGGKPQDYARQQAQVVDLTNKLSKAQSRIAYLEDLVRQYQINVDPTLKITSGTKRQRVHEIPSADVMQPPQTMPSPVYQVHFHQHPVDWGYAPASAPTPALAPASAPIPAFQHSHWGAKATNTLDKTPDCHSMTSVAPYTQTQSCFCH